jgi:hypothetical protein
MNREAFIRKISLVTTAIYFSDSHLLLKNINEIKTDMPVVTIQALTPNDPQKVSQTLKAVVQGLAAALNTANENVWAHFTPVSALSEGDNVFGGDEYHPVISVLANPRSQELINNGLNAIASAVSAGLGIKKENIWIHWVDLPPGRVYHDNKID